MLFTSEFLSDPESRYCPKCDTPITDLLTPSATGYCKECLARDWYVVSEPVIQDAQHGGVIIGGIQRNFVKWCRSSEADVADRKERAEVLASKDAASTTATQQEAPAVPQPATSETPPALVNEQAAVLKTLLRAGGVTMTVEMIVCKVFLSDRTVRKVLRSLRDLGLVVEPTPKKGNCLTAAGQGRTQELSADAGARLLKPESKPDSAPPR